MAPQQRKTHKVVEPPRSDSDNSELSYVSETEQPSSNRVGSKGTSSSKAKGKGEQVESSCEYFMVLSCSPALCRRVTS